MTDTADDTARRQGPSQATRLANLAQVAWETLRDADGMLLRRDLGTALVQPLASIDSRRQLARMLWHATGAVPSSSACTDALAVIIAEADQHAPELPVMHRYGSLPTGERVIDLALSPTDCRAVVLQDGLARIAEPEQPYRRRLGRMTAALPLPDLAGTTAEQVSLLRQHLAVSDDDWPALLAWCVTVLLGDLAVPVLVFGGESGTGKSTSARRLVSLLDPCPAPIRRAPEDLDAWQAQLPHTRVVALDNLSSIPAWLSDSLCTVVTGETIVQRRLYADLDTEPVLVRVQRAMIITSIDATASRGDLAERVLGVQLQHIAADARRTDAELEQAWQADLPQLFGALCHLTAQVAQVLPAMRNVRPLPRMADYGAVLAALDYLGVTEAALPAYLARQTADVAGTIDALGEAVLALVRSVAGSWTGTSADLLRCVSRDLAEGPRPKHWPDSPRAMTAALTRQGQALRAAGLSIDQRRTGSKRLVALTLT